MDTRTLIGYIIIDTIVFVVGVIISYFSVKRIQGSRERSFVIKMFVVMWLLVIGLFAGMILLPTWMVWIPYLILLVPLALYWNKRQRQIHLKETDNRDEKQSG